MSDQPLGEVPEADAVEQAQEVGEGGAVDMRGPAPEVSLPPEAPDADAVEQAQEVPLDDEEHDR